MSGGGLGRSGALLALVTSTLVVAPNTVAATAPCTIEGADGTDIVGTAGPDVICGAGGTYAIDAGDGHDIVRVAAGAHVTVTLGPGDDEFDGSLGASATVDGGAGSDTIVGTPGDDVLSGGAGDEGDVDVIDAGEGHDVVDGDENASLDVTLGPGDDEFDGGDADGAVVDGGPGDDEIAGTSGPDDLDGGGDDDVLAGVGDDDDLSGGLGNDIIAGGDGVDALDGGPGLNICDYTDTEPLTATCTYDDSPPDVTTFSLSPTTIEVGTTAATTVMTLRITDDLGSRSINSACLLRQNGVVRKAAEFGLAFPNPTSDLELYGSRVRLVSWTGNARDFTAEIEITVPYGTYPGGYTCHVEANDLLLQDSGRVTTPLTVTRAGSGFDDDGPVTEITSLTPDSVEVGEESATISMSVHATDQTAVSWVDVRCQQQSDGHWYTGAVFRLSFSGDDPQLEVSSGTAELISWSGTPQDVTAEVDATVPYGMRPGTYACEMAAEDALTQTSITPGAASFAVTRNGPDFDEEGPVVESISITPDVVDVGAASATVTMTVRATDVTGVEYVNVGCTLFANAQSYWTFNVYVKFDSPTSELRTYGAGSPVITDWSGDPTDVTATVEITIPFALYPGRYSCTTQGVDLSGHATSPTSAGFLTVDRTPPGQPTAPTDLAFTAVSPSRGTLSWDEPNFLGDPQLFDYQLQSSLDGTTWTTLNDGVSVSPSVTLRNLRGDTDYWFRSRGENGGGAGTWSAALQVHTDDSVVPSLPRSVVIDSVTHNALRVDWDAPIDDGGADVIDYRVDISTDGGQTWTSVPHAASTATSMRVSGLAAATTHLVRVAATNGVGTGANTEPVSAQTLSIPPSKPLDLTVSNREATSIALTWKRPANLYGLPVRDYLVEVSLEGESQWKTVTHPASNSLSITVSGLRKGRAYVFRVSAITAAGSGRPSSTVSASTLTTRPGSVTDLTVSSGYPTRTTVRVTWTAPIDTGGRPIVDYAIEYTRNAGRTWVVVRHPPSKATSITIDRLTPGTNYQVRVRATTSVGVSATAAVVSFTTPA